MIYLEALQELLLIVRQPGVRATWCGMRRS